MAVPKRSAATVRAGPSSHALTLSLSVVLDLCRDLLERAERAADSSSGGARSGGGYYPPAPLVPRSGKALMSKWQK